mmetsp:Transcript_9984/g.12656  ORF Transcript_9984/g.12656 Transcript_9984/m.12656 type:complete len:109 (-) Transcript_9984:128-454(-)
MVLLDDVMNVFVNRFKMDLFCFTSVEKEDADAEAEVFLGDGMEITSNSFKNCSINVGVVVVTADFDKDTAFVIDVAVAALVSSIDLDEEYDNDKFDILTVISSTELSS